MIKAKSPIILLQLITNLSLSSKATASRIFTWIKHNMTCSHIETKKELETRKSLLNANTIILINKTIDTALREYLATHGSSDAKVYVDEGMRKTALPLQEGSGTTGFMTLPKGSRLPINGKIVRAFTYWEKVNDIDLSMRIVNADGSSHYVGWCGGGNNTERGYVFSGDETSGYDGGSEYFDIDLDIIKKNYPNAKYIIFIDNVFSNTTFDKVICQAGFMLRDKLASGEIYEPKTVETSFAISAASRAAYLFAIDLQTDEMIWLNAASNSCNNISADTRVIEKTLSVADKFSVYDLYTLRYKNIVTDPTEADLIVSDKTYTLTENQRQIHSYDMDELLAEINK